jgi:hypothetical protein
LAGKLLRRGAGPALALAPRPPSQPMLAWPGSSSDSAVAVNRIEISFRCAWDCWSPVLVRRFFGPVRHGPQNRVARGRLRGGARAGPRQGGRGARGAKLGAYFADGGKLAGGEWFS